MHSLAILDVQHYAEYVGTAGVKATMELGERCT